VKTGCLYDLKFETTTPVGGSGSSGGGGGGGSNRCQSPTHTKSTGHNDDPCWIKNWVTNKECT
jgi:hypothetical protein